MKQTFNSFLQTVFQFVKALPEKAKKTSKKMYRSALAMTAGVSMVTAITSAAVGFHGNGRNALVAFAETPHAGREETALEKAGPTTESASSGTTKQDTEEASEEDPEPRQERKKAEETVQAEKSLIVQEDKTTKIKTDRRNEKTEEKEEPGRIVLPEEEYRVLLKIVQAEAGGCDEMGKILVANVILNRMEDEMFPDTVSGVVYQKHQFSPVSNGSINTCKVTESTKRAVDQALKGEDHSGGALYFMNRGASTSRNVKWFDAHLDFLFQHGPHEFFK